ncbi:MAG: exopolyphosphatase [bacterium]|nr:exopolyphosphatase [bacterium]
MRVVTRGDMDGLTGAVIVSLNEHVDSVELIHPQDITSGKARIIADDVLINVPYHPACGKWFDHHQHTATYREPPKKFDGKYGMAPSAARLVYDYYGGERTMPELRELVRQTDRLDSADLRIDDVTHPKGYILLGFTIDGRTGIGAFKGYFNTLYELLREKKPVGEVLRHPSVAQRVQQMEAAEVECKRVLKQTSRLEGNVVVTDLRKVDKNPIGNRFLIYALYPSANVSLRMHWGPGQKFVVFALGHSIFKRTCKTDVGAIAKRFGGGGHKGAGSIPLLLPSEADRVAQEIIKELRKNG